MSRFHFNTSVPLEATPDWAHAFLSIRDRSFWPAHLSPDVSAPDFPGQMRDTFFSYSVGEDDLHTVVDLRGARRATDMVAALRDAGLIVPECLSFTGEQSLAVRLKLNMIRSGVPAALRQFITDVSPVERLGCFDAILLPGTALVNIDSIRAYAIAEKPYLYDKVVNGEYGGVTLDMNDMPKDFRDALDSCTEIAPTPEKCAVLSGYAELTRPQGDITIYRGIYMYREKLDDLREGRQNINDFLEKMNDSVSSWSRSLRTAQYFACPSNEGSVGVVLQAVVRPDQVLADMGRFYNLDHLLDDSREHHGYLAFPNDQVKRYEWEVLARPDTCAIEIMSVVDTRRVYDFEEKRGPAVPAQAQPAAPGLT